MAVAIDGTVSEEYIRQSVDHILKISLPEEDYQPEPERYIIREVVVDVVLGVIPRISQPWFIHKVILDLLGPEEHHKLSGGVRIVLICYCVQLYIEFILIPSSI